MLASCAQAENFNALNLWPTHDKPAHIIQRHRRQAKGLVFVTVFFNHRAAL